ncbi:MAG TPA: ATP-binding protein [Steroidobacteraceae bacterium]|nr:ATP-binding protein [Steroidobacteraceae bacterium]
MNSLPQKSELPDESEETRTASGERQNLAEALAHERNVLRTMIDLIPAMIYAKDAQSRFTACNELVARRMGASPSDLIGKTDFDFFPREMAERFFADEQQLLKSGEALMHREEAAFDQTRGMNRTILTCKVPVRDEQGNVTGFVGTGYDITDRKAAEERMASLERHQSIGRLAAGVAHEINTPIQYLKDSVSFVQDGLQELFEYIDALRAQIPPAAERDADADENVEELRTEMPPALKLMSDGLSRIADIVRSMKDFSLVDKDSVGQFDLNRSIQSTFTVARSEYSNVADVDMQLGEIPPVTCNGGQINEVLLGLVINAADAIGDKVKGSGERGKITVRSRLDGEYVVIDIEDSGNGIPESIREKIFDQFFTTKEVGNGTGQGLSVARKVIINGHNGSLDFTSEMGKGTTFTMRLPVNGFAMA